MNRRVELATPPRDVTLIAAASGLGAPDPRCGEGPARLVAGPLPDRLRDAGLRVAAPPVLRASRRTSEPRTSTFQRFCARLARETERRIRSGALPIVLGGDHSCAVGTWTGAAAALGGPLGLVWIDAHMDAHTPTSSHSGMLHGMPLARLLGRGSQRRRRRAALAPEHVCLIGVRSYEPEEAALLDELGVRVIRMREVEERGLGWAFDEALAIASTGTAGYGITLDLDAIDPDDAPGVSVPAAGGLPAAAVRGGAAAPAHGTRHAPVEVVDYKPYRDAARRTPERAESLICGLFGERPAPAPALELRYGAHNYAPLPVTLVRGRGEFVWDDAGRRYIDMMSAYSAVSLGHGHPRVLAALDRQARTLAVTSRAYYNDRLPAFLARVCRMTGMDRALPANTGLEAVEVALKAARKWAYEVKGVPHDRAEIIACEGNFHGRSITIVTMSSEAQYRRGFGPFPAGFRTVPFGDVQALAEAITPHTAAFLVEPIQGERGILVPPPGYLAECARICRERNVLLIADEVQTGLGRTGRLLACDHEGVKPDGLVLGKALGGGLLPVSMFLARADVMGVFRPGDHGSTFGGNPLASAVGLAALETLVDERLCERAAELGQHLLRELTAIESPLVREVRGRGLFVGVDFDPARADAGDVALRLLRRGILTRDTHGTVIRLAPPLVISREALDDALARFRAVLDEIEAGG
ncbi:MAG: ornithine--oxo-acid transaminase [Burkholderiales bacterium]|nr:ornithine--oxo-acid transaminase [Burkholderiales bacterium]